LVVVALEQVQVQVQVQEMVQEQGEQKVEQRQPGVQVVKRQAGVQEQLSLQEQVQVQVQEQVQVQVQVQVKLLSSAHNVHLTMILEMHSPYCQSMSETQSISFVECPIL